jgi:hypothetical protein
MQLATRPAAGGAIEPQVVRKQFAQDLPALRIAMIGAVAADAPAWLAALVYRGFEDADAAIRLEAFEAALRLCTTSRFEHIEGFVRQASYEEPTGYGRAGAT